MSYEEDRGRAALFMLAAAAMLSPFLIGWSIWDAYRYGPHRLAFHAGPGDTRVYDLPYKPHPDSSGLWSFDDPATGRRIEFTGNVTVEPIQGVSR
jgi:hypothetical protein